MDILVSDFQRVRCRIENLSIPTVSSHHNMMCAGSHVVLEMVGVFSQCGSCCRHVSTLR